MTQSPGLTGQSPYPSVITAIKKADSTQASAVRSRLLPLYRKTSGTSVFNDTHYRCLQMSLPISNTNVELKNPFQDYT